MSELNIKDIESRIISARENNKKKKPQIIEIHLGKNEQVMEAYNVMPQWKKILVSVLVVACCVGLFLFVLLFDFGGFKVKVAVSPTISIESLKTENKLEVLSVSVSELIIDSKDTNKDGVEAWAEYTGTGVYTIDLSKSQFIVDDLRKTVIVRTPAVTVDQETFTLNYKDTAIKFFKNTYANDSYKDGVDLAQKQLTEAYIKIYNKIYTNPYYYETAEKAAERIIKSLIKGLGPNKNIEGLEVYVEIGAI